MKSISTKLPVLAITVGVVLAVLAVSASTAAEISIQNTQGLSFGSFVAGSGGTVTVSPSDTRSAGGGVMLMSLSAGAAARFTVSGDALATYTIQLPGNNFVKLTGPGAEMAVNDFTSSPSGAGGDLGLTGSQTLTVGATLSVGSGQASGSYSGTFTVTVNYN
jgi:hypothetical protein